jgi:hypothetical protein
MWLRKTYTSAHQRLPRTRSESPPWKAVEVRIEVRAGADAIALTSSAIGLPDQRALGQVIAPLSRGRKVL